ncbi:MAG: hypothetical protein AAF688_00940 [Bacteroidota bacterium]
MTQEDQIQNYLNGKLSTAERAEFERKLDTDADFKAAFEHHKNLQIAFEFNEANELKKRFEMLEQDKVNTFQKLLRSRFFYPGIAALFVLGFFIGKNLKNEQNLFDDLIDVYPNVYQPITRGQSNNDYSDAFVAYENSDFETAEKELESLLLTTDNENLRFYLALSKIQNEKFDDALSEFDKIDLATSDYNSEILWYSALIYLKKEQNQKSKQLLQQLEETGSAFKAAKRKKLMETL